MFTLTYFCFDMFEFYVKLCGKKDNTAMFVFF